MTKYICPHCGNDGSKGVFSKNMIIEAFWEGTFTEEGEFEIDECQPPDYENSSIHGADEIEDASLHRPKFHCEACYKDFHEPKKVE